MKFQDTLILSCFQPISDNSHLVVLPAATVSLAQTILFVDLDSSSLFNGLLLNIIGSLLYLNVGKLALELSALPTLPTLSALPTAASSLSLSLAQLLDVQLINLD
jgi:hypothetical protein